MDVGRAGRLGKSMLVVVLAVGLSAVAGCQGETKKDKPAASVSPSPASTYFWDWPIHFTKKWTYDKVDSAAIKENKPEVVRTIVQPGLKFVYYNDKIGKDDMQQLYVKVITGQGTVQLGSLGYKMTAEQLLTDGNHEFKRLTLFGDDVFKLSGVIGASALVNYYVKYDGKSVRVHKSEAQMDEVDINNDGKLEVVQSMTTVTGDVEAIYQDSKSGGVGADPMKDMKLLGLRFNNQNGIFKAWSTEKQEEPTLLTYKNNSFHLLIDIVSGIDGFAYTNDKITTAADQQAYVYKFGAFVNKYIKVGMPAQKVRHLLAQGQADMYATTSKDELTSWEAYPLRFDPTYVRNSNWKDIVDRKGFESNTLGAEAVIEYDNLAETVKDIKFYYVNPAVNADKILYRVNSDGAQDMTSFDGAHIYD